jgi:hypothetical protein
MSDTPTFKDRAVQTLALDIPVIRLRPRDKAALDTGWPALATTDLRTVCKWNSETPDANVGAVAKAELNAVWFFEIDSLDVIKRIETETGQKIPPTYRVRSRPGRGHYYWRQTPESIALGNIAQSFVKHGDFSVRVHNEYVAANRTRLRKTLRLHRARRGSSTGSRRRGSSKRRLLLMTSDLFQMVHGIQRWRPSPESCAPPVWRKRTSKSI